MSNQGYSPDFMGPVQPQSYTLPPSNFTPSYTFFTPTMQNVAATAFAPPAAAAPTIAFQAPTQASFPSIFQADGARKDWSAQVLKPSFESVKPLVSPPRVFQPSNLLSETMQNQVTRAANSVAEQVSVTVKDRMQQDKPVSDYLSSQEFKRKMEFSALLSQGQRGLSTGITPFDPIEDVIVEDLLMSAVEYAEKNPGVTGTLAAGAAGALLAISPPATKLRSASRNSMDFARVAEPIRQKFGNAGFAIFSTAAGPRSAVMGKQYTDFLKTTEGAMYKLHINEPLVPNNFAAETLPLDDIGKFTITPRQAIQAQYPSKEAFDAQLSRARAAQAANPDPYRPNYDVPDFVYNSAVQGKLLKGGTMSDVFGISWAPGGYLQKLTDEALDRPYPVKYRNIYEAEGQFVPIERNAIPEVDAAGNKTGATIILTKPLQTPEIQLSPRALFSKYRGDDAYTAVLAEEARHALQKSNSGFYVNNASLFYQPLPSNFSYLDMPWEIEAKLALANLPKYPSHFVSDQARQIVAANPDLAQRLIPGLLSATAAAGTTQYYYPTDSR